MKSLVLAALMGASALVAAPAAAQTANLTFDDLAGLYYGSGAVDPLPGTLTGNGQFVAYTMNGFRLTLNTPNDASTVFGAHIGDAGDLQTFNWHDNGDNGNPASVTLTRVGGGLFSLNSFSYATNGSLAVSSGALPGFTLTGSGTSSGFSNVSSINFLTEGYINNSLDNMSLSFSASSVPEPATWAMMLIGFGAVGGAMRRRSKVQTAVRFA